MKASETSLASWADPWPQEGKEGAPGHLATPRSAMGLETLLGVTCRGPQGRGRWGRATGPPECSASRWGPPEGQADGGAASPHPPHTPKKPSHLETQERVPPRGLWGGAGLRPGPGAARGSPQGPQGPLSLRPLLSPLWSPGVTRCPTTDKDAVAGCPPEWGLGPSMPRDTDHPSASSVAATPGQPTTGVLPSGLW